MLRPAQDHAIGLLHAYGGMVLGFQLRSFGVRRSAFGVLLSETEACA